MGLFNKKLSLEEILKAIEGLSDEEKAQIKAKMEQSATVEEEPKMDNEEEQADNNGTEEVTEQPKDVGEEEHVEEPSVEEPTEPSIEEPQPEGEIQPQTEELNGIEQENEEDALSGLVDRISALEEKLAQFDELKSLMEEYTKKQADSFGYKGAVPGAKKDIHDMSASELKQKMLNGEI